MNDRQSLGALGIAAGVLLIAITFFVTAIGGSKFDSGLDTESLKTGIPLALILVGIAIVAAGIGWLTDPSNHRPAWLQWIVPGFFVLVALVALELPPTNQQQAKSQTASQAKRQAAKKERLLERWDTQIGKAWASIAKIEKGKWFYTDSVFKEISRAQSIQKKLYDEHGYGIQPSRFTLLARAETELRDLQNAESATGRSEQKLEDMKESKRLTKRMTFAVGEKFDSSLGYGKFNAAYGWTKVVLLIPPGILPDSTIQRRQGVSLYVRGPAMMSYENDFGTWFKRSTYIADDSPPPTSDELEAQKQAVEKAEAGLQFHWELFNKAKKTWPSG